MELGMFLFKGFPVEGFLADLIKSHSDLTLTLLSEIQESIRSLELNQVSLDVHVVIDIFL